MKKILFSLLLFLFAFAFSPYLFADTGSVNYDLTFIEDYGYDLANGGTFESMLGYSCTGRTKIIGGSLKFTTVNAQYVLFWNSSGMFLGYDIIDSGGGLIYLNSYLGDGVYNTNFVYPYGAFTFALMCDNLTDNVVAILDTYANTFENPSYLNYTDSVIGGSSPTGTLADLGSYTTLYYDDVLTGSLQDAFNNPSYLNYLTEYNGMSIEDIFYRGGSAYETPSSEQLLNNPDFTDNIDGYNEESTGEISYDTGKLKIVKNAGNTACSFNFQTDFIEDNIYFIDVRTQRLDTVTFAMTIEDVGGDIYSSVVSSGTLTDLFMNEYYANYQAISDDVVLKGVGYTFTGGLNNNTTGLYFDYIRAYDLTAIFGSGNEPTADVFHEYLATDSYNTFRTIQNIGYSGDDLDDSQTTFTARSIPVLTLTNLIQNGQFTTDSNSDGLADNWYLNTAGATLIYDCQTMISFSGINPHLYTSVGNIDTSKNYYFSLNLLSANILIDDKFYLDLGGYLFYNGTDNFINELHSWFFNPYTATVEWLRIGLFGDPINATYLNVDNVSLFNSSTYTKTQIDNALINFGYLPYNITYYLPDMGGSGTGGRGFGSCGDGDTCYAVDGSGIGTDLEIYDYYSMYLNGYFTTLSNTGSAIDQWQEWRSSYGDRATSYPDTVIGINPYLLPLSVQTDFTTDHTARDYYIQLYKDAVNEVDRWEWYSSYGVTAENYSYYHQLFLDANDPITRWEWWKDDGITATNYDYYINFSVPHTLYADAVNEVDRYEWYITDGITSSNFNEYKDRYDILHAMTQISFATFDNSVVYWEYTFSTEPEETVSEKIINFLTNINPFWVIVFAFGVMGIIAVILMFAQAPFISYVIFETLIFVLFSIIGFFASWFIIIATAIMYIVILLLVKKKLGGM